ncbi:hypothetical protein F4780DRAFT_196189 [Xylariomycetidae sp. FL0641]|nr:hypothetical protein F4780DRAFT_196189 [Xylariomycetidae sp. FL0641]
MSQKLDQALGEIVAESLQGRQRGGGAGNRRREPARRDRDRDSRRPRDGVYKNTRDDSRGIHSDWVHDKFDERASSRRRSYRDRSPRRDQESHSGGTKLKVENLHYDLSEDSLFTLFDDQIRPGCVLELDLIYDRAGRSEGIAYVTVAEYQDAQKAIRKFDGANAKGQPIHLSILPSKSSRSLAERITRPRSRSPNHEGIDRYVPPRSRRGRGGGGGGGGGRRPGARREADTSERDSNRTGRDGRPKKTQEELDADMDDYWKPGGGAETAAADNGQAAPTGDDVDMIE